MDSTAIIGALVGIVLTVAVYELTGLRGTRGDETQPEAEAAASARASTADPIAETGDDRPTAGDAKAAQAAKLLRALTPDEKDRELIRLRGQVEDLEQRVAFFEGQLETVEGKAIPWPDDVPESFKKESMETYLKEFVADRGLGDVVEVDCSEFPCVALVQRADASTGGNQKFQTALKDMVGARFKGPVGLSMWGAQRGEGADAINLTAVSVMPRDAGSDVQTRLAHRAKLGLEQYNPTN